MEIHKPESWATVTWRQQRMGDSQLQFIGLAIKSGR